MNKSFKLGAAGVLAAGAVVFVSSFGTIAANADPSGSYTYVAVGSDTIQDLYNSFSAQSIGSWNATIPGQNGDAGLGSTIVPVNGQNPTNTAAIGRPNGSGDGRKALSAAWNPSNHTWSQTVTKTTGATTTTYTVPTDSIDIGRSSGKPATLVAAGASNDNLTSVPLARDAVAVATDGFSFNFTEPELQAIYGAPNTTASPTSASGTYTQVSGKFTVGDITHTGTEPVLVTGVNAAGTAATSTVQLNVLLPQASSGTRQFFQNALGNTANTTATWVNANNEENHADALTATGDIIPFSAAQFISQYNGVVTDTGVKASTFNLDSIGGNAPVTISGSTATPGALFGSVSTVPNGAVGTFNRDVYSVVPTQVITPTGTPTTYDTAIKTLVTSTLPNLSNITNYGFEKLSYSGTSTDWLHSPFEN